MADKRAILIGVDAYGFRPLTSAVNDAVAMREALVGRSTPPQQPILDDTEITLLATPQVGVSVNSRTAPATRDEILSALRPHYDTTDPAAFLLVYFAGHGLTASPDGRVRETLILPSDVTGPEDGRNMISINQLLNLFAERGPLQQLWIIDACRDMPYQRRPRGYDIEWQEQPAQGPRAQVSIFAVAQGGEALSESGGQGRFTTHLLAGLAGKGSAADYLPGRGYCVTAQSLHEYARRRVNEALEGYDDWTRTIQMPQISQSNSTVDPLRDLPRPLPRKFAVTVRPPEAEPAVDLALEVQFGLPVGGWPPEALPRIYELRATLKPGMDQLWGEPAPGLVAVDLREEDGATVSVPPRISQPPFPASQPQPAQPTTGERGIARAVTVTQQAGFVHRFMDQRATLTVVATDAGARVRLQRAESPWDELEEQPNTPISLESGVWNVMVVLGDQTISATRVVLSAGEKRTTRAVAQITPATAALLPPIQGAVATPETVMPSETIGPMQGAILPTLLPLFALKLYDTGNIILHQFEDRHIPTVSTDEIPSGEMPLAVAICIEGTRRPDGPTRVEGAELKWIGADSRISLFAGWKRESRDTITIDIGSRRVSVAAPGIHGGVTVVAGTSWPDGRLDFSVANFRLPVGTLWAPNPSPYVTVGEISRALALAAPLFRAGADLWFARDWELNDLADAKWLDPVLGVLAFHIHDHRLASKVSQISFPLVEDSRSVREIIRRNLGNYFRDLPDSRIVAALNLDPELRRAALMELLEDPDLGQPVVTASLAHIAQAATEAGLDDHWAVDRFARINPGQVFNVVRTR